MGDHAGGHGVTGSRGRGGVTGSRGHGVTGSRGHGGAGGLSGVTGSRGHGGPGGGHGVTGSRGHGGAGGSRRGYGLRGSRGVTGLRGHGVTGSRGHAVRGDRSQGHGGTRGRTDVGSRRWATRVTGRRPGRSKDYRPFTAHQAVPPPPSSHPETGARVSHFTGLCKWQGFRFHGLSGVCRRKARSLSRTPTEASCSSCLCTLATASHVELQLVN